MVGHRTAVCCGYRLCGGTVVERSASRSRSALAAVRSALVGSVRRPVVAILVLAGLGDILSGDPVVHGSALVLVGAAIALDGRRHRTADLAAVPVDRGPRRRCSEPSSPSSRSGRRSSSAGGGSRSSSAPSPPTPRPRPSPWPSLR